MRRACLILPLAAVACLAQQGGFVNWRLLKVDLMKPPPARPLPPPLPKGCLRVDRIERIPVPKDVDKAMMLPIQGPPVDPGIAIPAPPICPDQ